MNVTICDDMGANGFSWVTDEKTERTSHALAAGGRVWIVDPVDDAAMMARVQELGTPVAVVQLLNQHNRDCAAIARRLGIPHGKVPRSIPEQPLRGDRTAPLALLAGDRALVGRGAHADRR